MSYELVKRLRNENGGWASDEALATADLIEELEAAIDWQIARAEAAEANLAKAVEAFTRIDDLTCHNMPMTAREEQAINREVRAALAELKGKEDD